MPERTNSDRAAFAAIAVAAHADASDGDRDVLDEQISDLLTNLIHLVHLVHRTDDLDWRLLLRRAEADFEAEAGVAARPRSDDFDAPLGLREFRRQTADLAGDVPFALQLDSEGLPDLALTGFSYTEGDDVDDPGRINIHLEAVEPEEDEDDEDDD